MTSLAWLAGTKWYVPAANMLAYLSDPTLRVKQPVADQTLWSITSAGEDGFEGSCRAQLWVPDPTGGVTAMSPSTSVMAGTITDGGEITIVFTPDDPDQATTVGYGHLRRVEGALRMEMQMATGTSMLAIHWAYMTQARDDDAIPVPDHLPEPGLRSGEWRWMLRSAWTAMDEALFPSGAVFTLDTFRNGYFWGEGETAGGDTLRVAGSVTPEATLYILFSVSDQPAVARRGVIEGELPRMVWRPVEGGEVAGSAEQRL